MSLKGKRRRRPTRRGLLIGAAALGGVAAGRFVLPPSSDAGPAFPRPDRDPSGVLLNDISELSPTRVARHVVVRTAPDEATIAQYRVLLAEARAGGYPFIASAARHSMGGQSLARGGAVLTLDQTWLEADTASKTYRVAAGARWSTVIAGLDAIGFSPAVMQSNNDFGVASTFSVNAHGWPVPHSGCGSTVRSLRMLLADGTLVTCSRRENADIFKAAMGGYGLLGLIVDLDLDMVPNIRLEPTFERVPGPEVGARFAAALAADPTIRMAYGRMDISLDRFLDDARLVTYRPSADTSPLPPAIGWGSIGPVARALFRAQIGSDRSKHVRWFMETSALPALAGSSTRNGLMNESVATFANRDPTRTDILHEHFVAPAQFATFVRACKEVIPASYQQLLNVTQRYVASDAESVLAYAPEPRIAAVMLFSQEKTERGEADMARMTEALIERVLAVGGSFYLPYRPHARLDQVLRAYPRAAEFGVAKRATDPGLLFRNALWDTYLSRV